MDISLLLVFVAGLAITPVMVGLYIWWAERHTRRFKKAKATLARRGYVAVMSTDPRIQPWETKADPRTPAENPWFYKVDSGYTR